MAIPIGDRRFGELLDQLAAKTPTPGGGAVASAVGALGAALGGMVLSYSTGRKSLAAHEAALRGAWEVLVRARGVLLRLAEEDEAAYSLLNGLSRLPEGDPRRAGLPEASRRAAEVPLACVAACVGVLEALEPLPAMTNRHLRSDLAIAAILSLAAARAGAWNVRVNLPGVSEGAERSRLESECGRLLAKAADLADRTERACGP